MGLVKPLRMGTKATAGTCSRGTRCQHFPTAFLPVSRCLPPLLLLISTRWSYSNMALVAATGEQYATAYFISVTIFLKWVGFYEKSSSKKTPNKNHWSSMHILPGCIVKRLLAKIAPRGCRCVHSSLAPHWVPGGECIQLHLSEGLFCHGYGKLQWPVSLGATLHILGEVAFRHAQALTRGPGLHSSARWGSCLPLPSCDDSLMWHFCPF